MTQPELTMDTSPGALEARWAAVLERDAAYDGAFVFGVRSTGIYCRASCPARRPQRRQVSFFSTPAAAERRGFRPCKRCRPNQPRPGLPPGRSAVAEACRYLDANLERRVTLAELSDQVAISPHHLQRTFKRELGITPRQYAAAQRLLRFKHGLQANNGITGSIYDAGYGSSSRMYENAAAHLGMTPATYRKRGAGMTIHYTIVDAPLGRLLVGATVKGVSAISLGDADAALEQALRAEYPAADITPDATGMHDWVSAIVRHLQGEQPALVLPLDIQATAFQRRVWQELQTIPAGSTRGYGEVARRLGEPGAARAVAAACARNPVALAVPCHRVIREDGDLGGYRWGVDRKRALLATERASTGAGVTAETSDARA